MEAILNLLAYLPVADLLSHGISTDPLPFLYDVGQAVAALHLVAKGFVQLSAMTPYRGDDTWARKALGFTTSAMEVVARLGGAVNK